MIFIQTQLYHSKKSCDFNKIHLSLFCCRDNNFIFIVKSTETLNNKNVHKLKTACMTVSLT